MEFVPDWSGLLPELLEQIATRLPLPEDSSAFRGVCTTWRSAVPRKNKYQFKVPLLMLAERHDSNEREFYSLSKRKICARLPFPEAKDKKCIDVGFGWILTVSALGGDGKGIYGDVFGEISDGKVSLVKPFYSSPSIELPNLTKFPKYEESGRHPDFAFFADAVLLANPSETSDFMLVLVTDNYIAFWRNGDENWTVVNQDPVWRFRNMVYYKGCIYATTGSRIWMWDPNGIDLTKAHMIMKLENAGNVHDNKMYLVESTNGELLMIRRNNHTDVDNYVSVGANHFGVMKVDLKKRTFIEVEKRQQHVSEDDAIFIGVMRVDLKNPTFIEAEKTQHVNGDAIFVGNNIGVAVAAAGYPGVLKPNCIYFTDDCLEAYFEQPELCKEGGGRDMGIYNVEDGSIERFDIQSYSHISPPMWIFPSF